MTEPTAPARDRLFALIASIPGSGSVDWCRPARALLDEIAAVPAGQAPATDQTTLGFVSNPQTGYGQATGGNTPPAQSTDQTVSVDRAAVLRDFLWRLEQSAGDAAAEKFLDDNPELRRMADETPTAAPSAVVVRRATDETPGEGEATESVIYEVVGDWGVDSADSAEGARAAVAKWLRAYPKCGAYAQQRIVREWPDGSEFYGPWTDIPAAGPAVGAQQPKEEA